MASTLRSVVLALVAMATLSACGFQLRGSSGQYTMPFKSIYLAFEDTSPLGTELRRSLRARDGTLVVMDPARADARFEVLSENRAKTILSLNAQGRVREYLLTYTLNFRVVSTSGADILGPTEITLKRPLQFNETQVLAKESEEITLYRDMQTDLVQQIMRRLAAVTPA
jgi:LPS-assembly lipoprotein